MKEKITAKRAMQAWQEQTARDLGDARKLASAAVTYAYSGALTGESTVEYSLLYLNAGMALFSGYETIVAKEGTLTGTLVLHHEGVFENGVARIEAKLVPDACTGSFAGLAATARIDADAKDPMTSTLVLQGA